MTAKPVFPSAAARADTSEAARYYIKEAGRDVAFAFSAALEVAYAKIGESPSLGSPRYAHELGLPELRHASLKRFPYLVFYVEQPSRIEVWRVLHAKRDIPATLIDDA